jgi:photosystem II stability/assembly factor-like uncharacterized protein
MHRTLLASLLIVSLHASVVVGDPSGVWEAFAGSPEHGGRFEDVFAADEDHLWIVGASRVFASTDAGETWARQARFECSFFRAGTAVSDQIAFAGSLTAAHVLWQTIDGGENWEDISDRIVGPPVVGICGMSSPSSSVIYSVGRYDGTPRLVKTTDGGATWTSQAMDAYAATLIDVMFVDELHGFTVGGTDLIGGVGGAIVLETTDGGATWTERHVSAGMGEWGWKITFPSVSIGYVSVENLTGGDARILKTTDAGQTWADIVIPGHATLQGIGFLTESAGWVSGRGQASFTTDGGDSWQTSDIDIRMNRFRFVGSTGFAVGKTVYRYFPTQVSDAPSPIVEAGAFLSAVQPNPFGNTARIELATSRDGRLRLQVFDVAGRRVRTLVDEVRPAGRRSVAWDGTDDSGSSLPSGVYFYSFETGGERFVRKATIAR